MTAWMVVAKNRPVDEPRLFYPATVAYKQWVREQMRERKWTQQDLVNAMKRVDRTLTKITTATITDFLGPESDPPVPSSSRLLPVINKVFGIAPPPVCEPNDTLGQIRDRFSERWTKVPPQVQRAILELLGGDTES